jgi:hypothetical protein
MMARRNEYMSLLEQDKEQFVENAKKVYVDRLKDKLEQEAFGKIIALEPESGNYLLGDSFLAVGQASQDRFGDKPVYFFRVGGGGAVKIGGNLRCGRLSG